MHLMAKLRLISLTLIFSFTSSALFAFEEGALVVWINNDKGSNGLREVGERFTTDTGIRVIVQTQDDYESSDDPANRYARVAATTEGPDIIFWAHDRIGNWINDGYLQPVNPSKEVYDQLHEFAWNAVTVGDSIYGYPIAMEAISFIYNKDLIARPPKTWDEIIALDKQLRKTGKRALNYKYGDTYFTWPFITSAGGYSFKKADRVYQLVDVGLDNRGAIKGISMLNKLYREGVIEADDGQDWGAMMQAFKDGNVAMTINGPWTWNELNESGVNWGLGKFPAVDSNSGFGRPFVGFLAGYVNSFSPNEAAVKKFMEEYVLVYEGVKTIDSDRPLGAAANKKLQAELDSNPLIAHTFAMAATGETMPDIPEMKRFWSSMQANLQPMVVGEMPVEATLKDISQKLRRLDNMKMWTRKHYLAGPATE